jgi:peptide/nickel transport system permease protein
MGSRPPGHHIPANGLVLAGTFILAALLLAAGVGPSLAPHDPTAIDLGHRLSPPGGDWPLGTDHLGRCVWSRLLHGTRYTLGGGLATACLIVTLGGAVGLSAGLAGGMTDLVLMRLVDLILAFPSLVLALVLAGLLGASLPSVVLSLAAVWWAWYARVVRDLVLTAREKDFVAASRLAGSGGWRLVRGCILPQVIPPVLVLASLETGFIILAFSGFSFLGLGVQPPTPEWGAMLNESRLYLPTHPRLMLAPGAAVFLAVLAFNLVGEGLRTVLQVKPMTRW